jgi:hypothetical protein
MCKASEIMSLALRCSLIIPVEHREGVSETSTSRSPKRLAVVWKSDT